MKEDKMNWGYARLDADIGRVVHGPKLYNFSPSHPRPSVVYPRAHTPGRMPEQEAEPPARAIYP